MALISLKLACQPLGGCIRLAQDHHMGGMLPTLAADFTCAGAYPMKPRVSQSGGLPARTAGHRQQASV